MREYVLGWCLTITQRTETTPRQRELRALEIKEPQLALDVQARPGAPLTAPASV